MSGTGSSAAPPARTGEPASRASVAVAVITYRRPELLGQLLASMADQRPPRGHTLRIVVVDNDPRASAREVVQQADQRGPWPISYAVELEPGIPAARQRSVQLCAADAAVVFVDDDETCPPGWLESLVDCWGHSGADVVTGPVHGELPSGAPAWARDSDVHSSRGRYRAGQQLPRAFTNNTLVSRQVLDSVRPAFDPRFRFTGSSDIHFFQRVHRAGFTICWCPEAEVIESVPLERTTLGWLVRRAFRSGAGDAISRRMIRPGVRSVVSVLGFAIARLVNGLVLLLLGLAPGRRRARLVGLRRFCSGIGTVAGLFGVNHEEYRRRDGAAR